MLCRGTHAVRDAVSIQGDETKAFMLYVSKFEQLMLQYVMIFIRIVYIFSSLFISVYPSDSPILQCISLI